MVGTGLESLGFANLPGLPCQEGLTSFFSIKIMFTSPANLFATNDKEEDSASYETKLR